MCGIAGSVNLPLLYDGISSAMIHRGPDDQQGFRCNNVDFFHLRLSILDIEGGTQPMRLNNRFTIIFNGQIYNHLQLRKQFSLTGRTHSDTETLLLLFEKLGPAMLPQLDGMFVFAIYDEQKNEIFIARDRAGKKPLYYYHAGGCIAFASELNGLYAMVKPEIEEKNFYSYLHLGTFYRQFTPYKHVSELPGGGSLLINCATLNIKEERWWDVQSQYLATNHDDFQTAKRKVNEMLTQAVHSRIDSSDVEVGSFLSGGIDSGLVTAIAARYKSKIKTFTVSFPGAYDEAPLAKLVADKYQTCHTEITISFDHLKQDIEKIILNYGEPFFDSSAIPSYYVSREAKKHLTVILNGDGADELFGGYRRYVPFAKYDFFNSNVWVKRTAGTLLKFLPPPNDKKSKYNFIYRLASLASKNDVEIYLTAGLDIIEGFEQFIKYPGYDYLAAMRHDFKNITDTEISGLKKIMCMDFDCNLFSDLLVKMDIATMANSLEGRSPFLCKALLEYVPSLHDTYKIRGATTKYLLRKLAEDYLPPALIHQPKRGFEVPLKNWVNTELKEMIHGYLTASSAYHHHLLDTQFVSGLLNNQIRISAEKRAKILWTIFCMEVWYKNQRTV